MTWFRQYIAPFLIVLVFLVALLAVSARIFLPNDMAIPAPIDEVDAVSWHSPKAPGSPFLLATHPESPLPLMIISTKNQ